MFVNLKDNSSNQESLSLSEKKKKKLTELILQSMRRSEAGCESPVQHKESVRLSLYTTVHKLQTCKILGSFEGT